MVSHESGISDECGCIPQILHNDTTNFIQEEIAKCGRVCSGDSSQLCGGKENDGTDHRWANLYKVAPPPAEGSLQPCEVRIFEPQFSSTGVFPSTGIAGDIICMQAPHLA